MPEDMMDYQSLVERAMKGVVREALLKVRKDGLPGDHHLYITFRTQDDGVEVTDRLISQYPEEMTIVLQHQFWGLEISEDAFEITLSFSGTNERLYVPFDSVAGFADPSVNFGLQFETKDKETPSKLQKHRSVLEDLIDISGVSDKIARTMLDEYPTKELIRSATIEQLMGIPGIGKGIATAIKVRIGGEKTNSEKIDADTDLAETSPSEMREIADIGDFDAPEPSEDNDDDRKQKTGEVVALDAFRKKKS